MRRLARFVKETVFAAWKVATSKEGIKSLYGVSLYKNAIYLILNSIITSALGIIFWIVVARFYQPVDVGLAAALISAIALLSNFSNLGLHIGIVRFLPGAGQGSVKMINSCLTLSGLASLLAAAIFIAGISFWSPALVLVRQHPIFLASFILFTAILTLSGLLGQVFVAERSAKFILVLGLITNVLKIPLVIILAAFFSSFGIFGSLGIAMTVSMLVATVWLLPRIHKGYLPLPGISKSVIKVMVPYSLGNYFANLLWGVPTTLLPLMIVNILSAEMNAYFYIAWSIASVLLMVPGAIALSLFAEGSHREDLLWANTLRSLKICLVILLPAILLLFALGDKLLLLFGQAYSQSATSLLWILALSALPLSVINIFLSIKRVQKDMKSIMVVSVATVCIIPGLSYLLMSNMGIIGAGVGWTGGQTIIAVLIILLLYIKQSMGKKRLSPI